MIHSGSRGLGHQVATGNLIMHDSYCTILVHWHRERMAYMQLIGIATMPNRNPRLWAIPIIVYGSHFSAIFNGYVVLGVTQVPRSGDMAILCSQ